MSDIREVKEGLKSRAREVAGMLLPGGEIEGDEYVVDPGHGKIKVQIAGRKVGLWAHFGGLEGGDLIDLWRYAKGVSVSEAIAEASEFLGMPSRSSTVRGASLSSWSRPRTIADSHRPAGGDEAYEYLVCDRKISPDVLREYHILATNQGDTIVFPYLIGDKNKPELIMQKLRPAVHGGTPKPGGRNMQPILFGWHTASPEDRECLITEGEIDALSGATYGLPMPVLSVPFGGGGGNKQKWVDEDWDRLAQFETIYLGLDCDREGDAGAQEIARRLGMHRCHRVKWPEGIKDLNECLVRGVLLDTIKDCLTISEGYGPEGLKRVEEYRDKLSRLFSPEEEEGCVSLPWKKLEDQFLVRPGELTVWSGATGSGKSQVLAFCSCYWIESGAQVLVVSMEMRPERTLKRMTRQIVGDPNPTEDQIDRAVEFMSGKYSGGEVYLLDRQGRLDMPELMDIMTYARRRHGCSQVIVDSLMRLGIGVEDWSGQADAALRLAQWAMDERAHVHLVCHNRKQGNNTDAIMGTDGIKGAGEIGFNASNHIEIIRNKKVEEARDAIERGDHATERDEAMADGYGVLLAVHKQRNGDWEGSVGIEFEKQSFQYPEERDMLPIPFLPGLKVIPYG